MKLGFSEVARHRSKDVSLFRQGEINFIVNREPKSAAAYFAAEHGASACGLAFRVRDSHQAYSRALALGAQPLEMPTGPMELRLPAIKGIGGAPLYLIDRFEDGKSIYDIDFEFLPGAERRPVGHGLKILDHLTHNVYRGRMAFWANFYERLFNFREIRYFDIEGEYTGLTSKAMTAPDGRIRIPLNEESKKGSGQIEEFLMKFNGEGIQHVALLTDDLFATIDKLSLAGVPLMSAPNDVYYEMLEQRLPGHGLDVDALQDARHPRSTAAPRAASRVSCCRSSPRRCSAPSSSSSSSARATKDSAKATSRRCSNRWSATRCAVVCWRRRRERAARDLRLPVGLRQHLRDRGACRRAAGRAQFAAALPVRSVRRAAERHRVHGAARRQPQDLAVPDPPVGDARAVRARRRRSHRRQLRRGRGDAQPAALEPAADAERADRLRRRPGDDGGQRRPARADRRRGAPVRGEPLDGAARVLRRRRRAADRSAAGPPALRHRARNDRRRAAGDRRRAARRALPGRAARPRGARLRVRELRRQLQAARPRADRLERARQPARLPDARGRLRGRRRAALAGRQVPGPPLVGANGPLAVRRRRLARQLRAVQVRPQALQRDRLDQPRPPRSVDLPRPAQRLGHRRREQHRLRDLPAANARHAGHVPAALVPSQQSLPSSWAWCTARTTPRPRASFRAAQACTTA